MKAVRKLVRDENITFLLAVGAAVSVLDGTDLSPQRRGIRTSIRGTFWKPAVRWDS